MKKRPSPTIVAHRGLHAVHPENSLSAFKAAWDAGIDWCECDVRIAGEIAGLVIHDETLDRTTDMTGRLDAHPWSDITNKARLRLADGSLTDERVPAIDDVFRVIQSYLFGHPIRRKYMLVEIKAPCPAKVPISVANWILHVQSFDIRILLAMRAHSRRSPSYLLVENPDLIARNLDAPWTGLNIRHDLIDAATVEKIHGRGKTVGVWTPNSEQELRRAIELGVDTIITDEPLLAQRLAGDSCGSSRLRKP